MIKSLKILTKQILMLLIFTVLVSIASIIHGVFFDLDFIQIKRLTIEGLIFTFVVIFPVLLFLEWVFDINNRRELDNLKRKTERLEEKIKRLERIRK